ncbi:mandelate racemase/muconate lactonizing enzyme family protein [Cellulomonas hominis]|uniref:Mandelate racemase/muconate lactonizing enzyme family protein n=1 Tax=Cellulomonas hominis TaxID=156981 RepID=A0A7Z8K127_9CELL|nr:mandelate racemase/muconate lactonizing enzyme family protein [Cellulomonas hominis]TKR24056.1 mandelate racemase/muconate lactonizing enzyme family protein [Cellulomonas hominis]
MKIDSIEYQLSRLPLPCGPWGDQIHVVTHIEIITSRLTTDTGVVGVGLTHTSGVGGASIMAMLRELTPTLLGREVAPVPLWHDAWQHLRDNGVGGTTSLALAAVDVAVWDAVAKERGVPLADLLGRVRDRVPVYGSGINLNLSVEEVVEQVRRWRADGCFAAKVKVGKPDLEEDVERLTRIREAVGAFPLMVDANQGWTYDQAVRAMRRFAHLDLYWVEEPLRVDDVEGHARLRARATAPIGLGENVYTLQQFNQYLRRDACDVVQADVGRVGGITPYLDIAALARAYGVPMAPHFVLELSAHLLCAVPNALCGEMTEGGTLSDLGVIAPQPVQGGYLVPPDEPGHGLLLDHDHLALHRVEA